MATSFLKRQKEMKRRERQREKAERRAQRKLASRQQKEHPVDNTGPAGNEPSMVEAAPFEPAAQS